MYDNREKQTEAFCAMHIAQSLPPHTFIFIKVIYNINVCVCVNKLFELAKQFKDFLK